jgi:hypothetical protein
MMTPSLARRQLALTPWENLRSGSGDASRVSVNLETLLFVDSDEADDAYANLENEVEAQGELFECAPGVVAVIVAAIAEDAVPAANMRLALDVLGRVVAGYPARSELAIGNVDLRDRCHSEAMKAYWPLMRVAVAGDELNAWALARDVLGVLDEGAARRFLGGFVSPPP